MEVNKYLNNIIVDGNKQNFNKDSISKIEIHRKAVNKVNIVLEYIIKVSNVGEIGGNIEKVIDELPEGMTLDKQNSDNKWEEEGNCIVIKEFANKELGVGESREYKVVLKWNNSLDNFGAKVNKARI